MKEKQYSPTSDPAQEADNEYNPASSPTTYVRPGKLDNGNSREITVEIPLLGAKSSTGTIVYDVNSILGTSGKVASDDKSTDADATVAFSFADPDVKPLPPDGDYGNIEREIATKPVVFPSEDTHDGFNKLGVTMIAILILMATILSGILFAKAIKKADIGDDFYLNKLDGTWISDSFVFADDEQPVAEYLTINRDGTFTLQYLAVDTQYADGYLDGSWQILEEYSGTVEIYPEELALVLIREVDATKLGYRREFVKLEDQEIVLREYYDETLNTSFDIHLTRVK